MVCFSELFEQLDRLLQLLSGVASSKQIQARISSHNSQLIKKMVMPEHTMCLRSRHHK